MQNPQCLLCLVLIYFVSFKLFTRQILRYLSQHNNLGGGDWAGINKNVTDTFSSLTGGPNWPFRCLDLGVHLSYFSSIWPRRCAMAWMPNRMTRKDLQSSGGIAMLRTAPVWPWCFYFCLSVCLSFCLFVYLSVCLFVYQSVCPGMALMLLYLPVPRIRTSRLNILINFALCT